MLKVWGRKTSSNVQAVMWCIGELGLDHERFDIGHRFAGTDTPAFRGLNPNGTIPVIKDGDHPALWETGAIVRYLASAYGTDTFWPKDPAARAQVDKWAEWSKINIAMAFTGPVFWQVVRTPRKDQDPEALKTALKTLEDKLALADSIFTRQPFLAGNTLTLADIQFGHCLYRYYSIDIVRRALPALSAYYNELQERAAFQHHVMVPYEELRPIEEM